jgi:hypothetical protein
MPRPAYIFVLLGLIIAATIVGFSLTPATPEYIEGSENIPEQHREFCNKPEHTHSHFCFQQRQKRDTRKLTDYLNKP